MNNDNNTAKSEKVKARNPSKRLDSSSEILAMAIFNRIIAKNGNKACAIWSGGFDESRFRLGVVGASTRNELKGTASGVPTISMSVGPCPIICGSGRAPMSDGKKTAPNRA